MIKSVSFPVAHHLMTGHVPHQVSSRSEDEDGQCSNDSSVLRRLERARHTPEVLAATELVLIAFVNDAHRSHSWQRYPNLAISIVFGVHERDDLRESAWRAVLEDQRWGEALLRHAQRRRWDGPKSPKLTAEARVWCWPQERKWPYAAETTNEMEQVAFARDPQRFVRLTLARNPQLCIRAVHELLRLDDVSVDRVLLDNEAVDSNTKEVLSCRLKKSYN